MSILLSAPFGLITELKGIVELLPNGHGEPPLSHSPALSVPPGWVPICKWEHREVVIWSFALPGALRKTLI